MRNAALVLALLSLSHCSSRTPTSVGPTQTPRPDDVPATTELAPAPAAIIDKVDVIDKAPAFGAPAVLGRLAVYPVTLAAAAQTDPGPLLLLDDALARGVAEVREIGDDPAAPAPSPNAPANDPRAEQIQQRGTGGAVVGTLVIENKSDTPIFVLAGTVVKGGKQDRQIGQDFVVDARRAIPVDAFCVEQGRWDANREGASTDGKFAAVPALATSKVRAAGQYLKNQQAVWDNVAETNKAHKKSAQSGTLLATLDDREVRERLDDLTARIGAHLGAGTQRDELVGLAWAIDGQIQGVRYFAHRSVFGLVADKLTRAAAVDAITAEAAGPAPEDGAAPPSAAALASFVAEVERGAAETRETPGGNDNEYRESERAWGMKTVLKAEPGKKARPLAFDFVAK
jgi:hypothetical protein